MPYFLAIGGIGLLVVSILIFRKTFSEISKEMLLVVLLCVVLAIISIMAALLKGDDCGKICIAIF